jgi:GrpB-like predicted nucleotidyltransferase (UPF0157 family)
MPAFTPASKPAAEFVPYDPLYAEVADRAIAIISTSCPTLQIEHVGSTAVPGCAGKGVIDLIAIYEGERLQAAVDGLLSVGLQRQGPEFARRWPESRPMLLGHLEHRSTPFLVYVHVVRSENPEIRRFRIFRERLRADPDLVARYAAEKKAIVEVGIADTDEYAVRKRPIIHEILGDDHTLVR